MKAALSQAQPIKVSNSSAAQQQHQQLRQIQQTIPERKSQTQKMTQMPQVYYKRDLILKFKTFKNLYTYWFF